MLLSHAQNRRKEIKGVVKDPDGIQDLDISYRPAAITPAAFRAIREMLEAEAPEEDQVRKMLVTFGMKWNLTDYVEPEDGDPVVLADAGDGTMIPVKAGADGKPLIVDIPATNEGMENVALSTLAAVLTAIQDDATPNPTSNVS